MERAGRRCRALIGLACVTVLLGCAAPELGERPATPPSGEATSTEGSAAAGVPALDSLELTLEPVAAGLEQPLFVTNAGDGSGRLFVVEQGGRIRVVKSGAVAPRPFLDVSARISTGGERGLLGLAFAPDYATSGRFYVNYTDRAGATVVARFVANDPGSDAPEIEGPEALLAVEQPYSNHNGGCIAFAPDGTLWVGMGDGGSAGDPENRAQDAGSLLGKMLSLDVERVDRPQPKVVMSGLRNPWRFSFDEAEDEVWIGDVGQNAWEEIDVLLLDEAQGANLGWNEWEGAHPYPADAKRDREGFVFPAFEYSHDVGQSVTGGYVYRGKGSPALTGTYLYGDFVAGWVGVARKTSDGSYEQRIAVEGSGIMPSSFGLDEQGEVYVCDYNGALLRVSAR